MANQSTVRFDHREIAVIFSLFVFVSLLMFTVGILVGKGLSQPSANQSSLHNPSIASLSPVIDTHSTGTSVSTDHHASEGPDQAKGAKSNDAEEHGAQHANNDPHDATAAPHTDSSHGESHAEADVHREPSGHEPLELVPEKPALSDPRAGLQEFPKTKEVETALKNPRLQGVFEGGHTPARATASTPKSSGETFTVQVGSYPSKQQASDRVESLKKLGFPQAFLSATQNNNSTWYRVWLGNFPDSETARKNGESLRARGEVKNYLVRRSDKKD